MNKILFIATHRIDSAPGQRFRFEQYFNFLEQNGFSCTLSSLIRTPKEHEIFYGNDVINKIRIGIAMGLRRLNDILHRQEYDIIFVAREAFVTGGVFFERALKKSNAKLVYDFDDAIWIDVISEKNRVFAWLKDGGKTKQIIGLADLVIAGNEYLAQYARPFNSHVVTIPTTINTDVYRPRYHLHDQPIVIGWSGSHTTIDHFRTALPALTLLKEKYGNRIKIRVIGDANFRHEQLSISGMPWRRECELEDLWPIDIGIMPLPDNEWTSGKCGLKGLQYMALEIPTVMSPVGVNSQILQEGVSGFFASSSAQWVEKISHLIEHDDLRLRIGKEGRKIVETRFSVNSQKENYLTNFENLLANKPR